MSVDLTKEDKRKLTELKDMVQERGQNSITKSDCNQIRSLYKRGETVETIEEKVESRRKTLYYHLKGACCCDSRENSVNVKTQPLEVECPVCGIWFGSYQQVTSHIRCKHND